MTKAVAAGQIGGREAVRGREGDLDGPGRREIRTKARARLPIESGERTDRDRLYRQLVFLQDDEADAAASGGVDAIPTEELLHRDRVVRLVGLTKICGERAETVRIPPAPGGD